tara:strand:- start:120 stop:776 length:657 start_codon:yes stop_codon:yes gene_type:complete
MNFFLAIFPPLLIAYIIYKQDKYDKEPRELIIKSFLFGCLSVIPILLLEIIFNEKYFLNIFLYMLLGVALIEEGMKFFFLKKYLYDHKEFNEPLDGIVYAVMISLGFATVENLLYVFVYAPGKETYVAVLRMFSAIPLHASCGVVMGYFVGKAKFNKNSTNYLIIGLLSAIIIHGFYNYFVSINQGVYFAFLTLFIAIYFSKKAIKIHQFDSKKRFLK